MKIRRIEREVCHRIFVGGFETIEPRVRLAADLEDGDNLEEALSELDAALYVIWTKEVLAEIRLVHKRRGNALPEDNKIPDLMQGFKALHSQMSNKGE